MLGQLAQPAAVHRDRLHVEVGVAVPPGLDAAVQLGADQAVASLGSSCPPVSWDCQVPSTRSGALRIRASSTPHCSTAALSGVSSSSTTTQPGVGLVAANDRDRTVGGGDQCADRGADPVVVEVLESDRADADHRRHAGPPPAIPPPALRRRLRFRSSPRRPVARPPRRRPARHSPPGRSGLTGARLRPPGAAEDPGRRPRRRPIVPPAAALRDPSTPTTIDGGVNVGIGPLVGPVIRRLLAESVKHSTSAGSSVCRRAARCPPGCTARCPG